MSDAIVAWIRTTVPIAVGSGAVAVSTWLADHQIGWIHLDSATAGATAAGLAVGAYYTIVKWLETRWPRVGVLLGKAKQPTYPS